jgi:hypothetical protein
MFTLYIPSVELRHVFMFTFYIPSEELRHLFMLTFYIPSQELRHVFMLTFYIPSKELRHVFMLDEKHFEVLSVWHYPFIYSLARKVPPRRSVIPIWVTSAWNL